ncbi:MAG: glycoside hydrolase family 2 protein, partial [Terracidiphilus sp.]
DLTALVEIYNLDGTRVYQHETKVTAAPDVATDLDALDFPANLSAVHFIKLELRDKDNKLVSSNFYWRAQPDQPAAKPAGQLELRLPGQYDDLTALNQLPMVTLTAQVKRADANGQRTLTVTVHNPSPNIALMAHLQLRRKSGERVLPVFYSDNYISLAPNETKTITVEAAVSDFNGEDALVVFDGWNVTVAPASFSGAAVAPNLDAQPDHSPASGLLYQTAGLR